MLRISKMVQDPRGHAPHARIVNELSSFEIQLVATGTAAHTITSRPASILRIQRDDAYDFVSVLL